MTGLPRLEAQAFAEGAGLRTICAFWLRLSGDQVSSLVLMPCTLLKTMPNGGDSAASCAGWFVVVMVGPYGGFESLIQGHLRNCWSDEQATSWVVSVPTSQGRRPWPTYAYLTFPRLFKMWPLLIPFYVQAVHVFRVSHRSPSTGKRESKLQTRHHGCNPTFPVCLLIL